MELIIKIGGTASLKEVYENPKDRKYYAILSMTAEVRGADKYVQPKIDIEVPITVEQYWGLKRELSESKAEKPVLCIRGNLELILDSVCIN